MGEVGWTMVAFRLIGAMWTLAHEVEERDMTQTGNPLTHRKHATPTALPPEFLGQIPVEAGGLCAVSLPLDERPRLGCLLQ